MSRQKRHSTPATAQHRQVLVAVLYLASVLLVINAWLVSQQLPG